MKNKFLYVINAIDKVFGFAADMLWISALIVIVSIIINLSIQILYK